MGVLYAAIFQRRGALQVDCESPIRIQTYSQPQMLILYCRFAFVEYEGRRDADDAYHEMHNKRIGRDDVLKIEVC